MMSTAGSDPDVDLGYELEDGELSRSDVEEGTYVPLERPDNLVAQLNPASIMNMQIQDDHSDESNQDTSTSESESEAFRGKPRTKKPKIKFKQNSNSSTNSKVADVKRSKYSVWCKTLEEDVLTEDMNSCEFLKSRHLGIESYDHTIKYHMNSTDNLKTTFSKDAPNVRNSMEKPVGRYSLKRTKDERSNVKLRLGKSQSVDGYHDRGVPRNLSHLSVTIDSSAEEVAKDLAEKLCEDKDELVLRVVTIAGKERAIEIFQETKRIEEDGGMMVMNGLRRRTPGGVYFFLVKRDEKITKDMIKQIFQEDKQEINRIKKRAQAKHREKKVQQLKQSLTDSDLPTLLTRSEQALQGSSVGTSDRKNTDEIVSNPPPSPVTDGKDGSSDTDTQRSPQPHGLRPGNTMNVSINVEPQPNLRKSDNTSYDDDFLDINCGDDMDLF